MGWEQQSVKKVFERAGIRNARVLVGEYDFRLEGTYTNIRIWIYEGLNGDWVEAEQNYYLQAPGMSEPAVPETQRYRSAEEAIDEILTSFLSGYSRAIAQGYEPSSDWLMPAN